MYSGPYLEFDSNFRFLFYKSYFGCQRQSNEATRQLGDLPLHLGYRGHSEPMVGSMKHLTMQHPDVFWNTTF